MPDTRAHRGPHPEDRRLFAPANLPRLREAVRDLSHLLSRGYAPPSSLKLVGDRYALDRRQRTAVLRCACSDQALESRRDRRVPAAALQGAVLLVDGYNVLTTVEAALAGGLVLQGRDGCLRDLASMHGTWRRVEETVPALEHVGRVLDGVGARGATWMLDRPVSNSGRLAELIRELGARRGWSWEVRLAADPDPVLAASGDVVATADSVVLDRCRSWVNLTREVVEGDLPAAWVVRLGLTPGAS